MRSMNQLTVLAIVIAFILIIYYISNTRFLSPSATALDLKRHHPTSEREQARAINHSRNANQGLSHTIPKIIHHKWKTQFVPRVYLNYILSWRTYHPDYEHWWWDDPTSKLFIRQNYPTFLDFYNKLPYDIQRADVIRYFMLYKYGGIYKDLDIESIKNIQPYLDQFAPCIVSEEPEVNSYLHYRINYTFASNAFFACRPKHPFFDFVMKSLEASFTKYRTDLGHSTGPFFIHRMVKEYRKAHPNPDPLNRIVVTPAKYIQPTYAMDGSVDKNVKKTCKQVADVLDAGKEAQQVDPLLFSNQARICEQFKRTNFSNTPGPEAYCDHHWSHSYLYPSKYTGDKVQANVNIRDRLSIIDPQKRFASTFS